MNWIRKCCIYTPDDLALAVVRRTCGRRKHIRCLEPSAGNGAFLKALCTDVAADRHITAVELDTSTDAHKWADESYIGQDFLLWAKSNCTNRKYDIIVGNPPFAQIRVLPPELKRRAANTPVPGGYIGERGNLWAAFFAWSLQLLAKGGSIGFVLPAAWDYATYAQELRETCQKSFGNIETYRCERPIFDEVIEGAVILVARNYGHAHRSTKRVVIPDRNALVHALGNRCRSVKHERASAVGPSRSKATSKGMQLSSMATIRIGGVTGHASYFLMNEHQRVQYGLPTTAFLPAVTRASHLQQYSISKKSWTRLLRAGERVLLFRPNDEDLNEPSVREYLELPRSENGCNRLARKVRDRDPWYRTKLPEHADAFISGMTTRGPVMVLNSMTGLTATNTLYVLSIADRMTKDQKAALAACLLLASVRKQIMAMGRQYADGLFKIEPRDIGRVVLPIPRHTTHAFDVYREAFSLFRNGYEMKASNLVRANIV